jgi:TolB-like protein/DNA-binding winged helix-turn-helix (wHTH) protein/cytochrome c-type biogenesis protein CcmH/NrfG
MSDAAEGVLFFDDWSLDIARRELRRGEQPVDLRPKSFDVLACLARNAGRVVTKDELMTAVWAGVVVTDESLTRCISDIRLVLGDDALRLIKTVPRRGYVFTGAIRPAATPVTSALRVPSARGGQPADRSERLIARRPWLPATAVLLALVLGVGAWLVWRTMSTPEAAPSLSIVVLPLASRDASVPQYLAEAVTEEITIDLSRIPGSFVIASSTADSYRGRQVDARRIGQELGVRYVLQGGVDRLDEAVRLHLQLVDAASGRTVWAERFDGALTDLPALHRQVTGAVAQRMQLKLLQAESARATGQRPADRAAQDLVLQAWSQLRRQAPADVAAARELLQRALALDPESAFAWSLLARTYAADVGGRSPNLGAATRTEWLRRGEQAADRAYALEPDHPDVLGARAWVLVLQGRGEAALALVERHLAINRNDATAWFRRCHALATLGRPDEAIPACEEALRLSPRDADLALFYVVLAAAHLHLGNDAQALQWARKSALERPQWSVPHSWVASAAAHLDDDATAKAAIGEFRRLRHDYTVASFRAEGLCANALCERQRERYYDGLLKAGLPP